MLLVLVPEAVVRAFSLRACLSAGSSHAWAGSWCAAATGAPRAHDFYLLLLPHRRTGTHTVGLVTYELRPGSLFFLAPGVALVAYELGFADASYFGRYFRKYTGRPPEAFRQQR